MRLTKTVAMCGATLALMASEAVMANEWMVNLGVEDFRWREFDGGTRLVEESGARYSLGVGLESPMSPDALTVFSLEGKLYFGTVDYDGHAIDLQTGVLTPSTSETDYNGFLGEALISQRYPRGEGGAFEFFGGAGLDAWTREIASTAAASGGTEDWTVFYGKIGGGWRASAYMLRAGVKLPLVVNNATDMGFDLEPKGRASLFLLGSVTVHDSPHQSWAVNLFYDSYRFAESNHVVVSTNIGPIEAWQPESEQDVWGLQVVGRWR